MIALLCCKYYAAIYSDRIMSTVWYVRYLARSSNTNTTIVYTYIHTCLVTQRIITPRYVRLNIIVRSVSAVAGDLYVNVQRPRFVRRNRGKVRMHTPVLAHDHEIGICESDHDANIYSCQEAIFLVLLY